MSTFLWSDTHFNHRGIIDYCKRPYSSVQQMNEELIKLWNSKVAKQDSIYLLGDFGFCHSEDRMVLPDIFNSLHGHKHLVIGNHDEKNPRVLKLPWESQRDIVTLKEEGVRAVACHYPMETWKQAHRGYLMLHGHSHGSLKRELPHRFDVGVDSIYGKDGPIALQTLAIIALGQKFQAVDHHAEEM